MFIDVAGPENIAPYNQYRGREESILAGIVMFHYTSLLMIDHMGKLNIKQSIMAIFICS